MLQLLVCYLLSALLCLFSTHFFCVFFVCVVWYHCQVLSLFVRFSWCCFVYIYLSYALPAINSVYLLSKIVFY